MKNSLNILFALLLSLSLLASCAPSIIPDIPSHEVEEPQPPSGGDEVATPVPGAMLTVTFGSAVSSVMFPSEYGYTCEIPFTISPAVEALDIKMTNVSGPETEIIMSGNQSGYVIVKSSTEDFKGAALSISATEVGENITPRWCESNTVTLDYASIKLSVECRETQPSGTDHAEFRVTSNVGFDPIVDEDFSSWISVVSIDEGVWVVVSIAENVTTEAREGTIKVWDAGHNFYKVYTVCQKGKTPEGDEWSIGIDDLVDGGDYHVEY